MPPRLWLPGRRPVIYLRKQPFKQDGLLSIPIFRQEPFCNSTCETALALVSVIASRMLKKLRIIRRFIFFVSYTFRIVSEIRLKNLFLGADMQRSMAIRERWARRLLRGIGVRLQIVGTPPAVPVLLVSNHRSYLDPIFVLCDTPAYPVAKAELADWPLLGKGAELAGILYLKRESVHSRAGTLQKIQQVIDRGFPVLIYPEGTTSSLNTTLPFKKGVFLLAAKSGIPVVPVALCFAEAADYWVGRETFLRHAGRRFQQKEINVTLVYGPVLTATNADALMEQSKSWIDNQLKNPPGAV